jgi:Cysteine-rich secretory protein family
MRRLASLFVSVMLALGTFAWMGPAPVVLAQDAGYSPDGEEWAFIDLLNAYRGELGLAPVTLNSELGAAAKYHSVDMATNNYFSHYSLDGIDAGANIQNFGYTGFPYAENIAAGMETAQEVLTGWQNSPEHNATMTNPQYTEVGIGRAYNEGTQYGWYWTATYGGGEGPQTAPVQVTDPALVTEITIPETGATVDEAPSVITNDGGTVELVEFQQPVINADGEYVASSGANPVADGTGETLEYGDLNTGGVQGETIVYEEPSLTVSGEAAAPAPAPAPETTTTTTTTTAPAPEAAAPVSTDGTFTETTTTVIEMNEGNGQARG